MACFCTLVMQAQEVKSVSLDSIPKASLPKEGMSLEYSRPSLDGFPVLQGKSYYSESNAPWMSEEGKPLEIAPNAIPHISLLSPNLGTMAVYSSGIEVPGLMNRQTAGVVYQQNFGRFVFSPYVGIEKINTGVYGLDNMFQRKPLTLEASSCLLSIPRAAMVASWK